MNRNLKQALRMTFDAPKPIKKHLFLSHLPYKKTGGFEFFLWQAGYIRKRFWCLSFLPLICMAVFSMNVKEGTEFVGILSACLPLLTLTGMTEIRKSVSFHMTELEMSCKYNLGKITLVRLSMIGFFHFTILLLSLFLFKGRSQYGFFRYALYAVLPFLLSSYLSFWVTNHIKSKDNLYICGGITAFVSTAVFAAHISGSGLYRDAYAYFWAVSFITVTVLLMKEIYFLLKERNGQWNFA